jgi:uncharacterized protein (TIGR02996 family)
MTPADAFLQEILEHPEDDVPRLVFADWLMGQDDPVLAARGEFIRLQIERHRLPDDDPRREQPSAREQELALRVRELPRPKGYRRKKPPTQRYIEAWAEGLPAYCRDFSRGFVESVYLHTDILDVFHADAEEILRRAPVFELSLGAVRADALLAWFRSAPPYLPRISSLHFACARDNATDEVVQALSDCPTLTGLRTLLLGFCEVGDDGLRALAAAPRLASLRSLSLCAVYGDEGVSTRLTAAGVAALAASPHLAGLTALDLSRNDVGDEGARALAASPRLTGLRDLLLFDAALTDAGVAALAASPALGRLERLLLGGENDVGDAGLEALAASPHLAALVDLTVGGQGCSRGGRERRQSFGDAGARALARSPRLKALRRLTVGDNDNVTEAGWQALRERFGDGLRRESGW